MAKQGRKNKNELDIILEQLKKSYASDAIDSLEDDLLENPADEEDTELNEILGRIFAYDDPRSDFKPDSSVNEEEAENLDLSSSGPDSASDMGIGDGVDLIEEDATDNVQNIEPDFEIDNDIESAPSDIDTVDNVLKEMFGKRDVPSDVKDYQNAIESIIDDADLDRIIEESVSLASQNIEIVELEAEELYIENVAEDFEEPEEGSIEYFEDIEDFEDLIEEECTEAEIGDDHSLFAVEDEEYAFDNEEVFSDYITTEQKSEEEKVFVPYPIPHIILSSSQYTVDPLQDELPVIDSIPTLEYLREKKIDTQNKESTVTRESPSRDEAFDDNDISLLLKFGYHDEIKSKVGEKKTKEVLLEADNSYVPDPTKKVFGYCGKELNDRKQIPEIREKYKTDQRNIIILLSVVGTLSLCLFYINLTFEFFSDKASAFPIMLLFDFIIVMALCGVLYKKIASGFNKLMKLGTSANTLFFIVAAGYGIYSVSSLIAYTAADNNYNESDLMLFGFWVALYAILCLVADLFNCIRERRAFEIIASSNIFYTAEKSGSNHTGKYGVDENATYRIRKTGLISGYFRKTSQNEEIGIRPLYLLGIVPIITLASAVTVFFISRSFALGASAAIIILFLCIPAPYLFTSSLIRFIISKFTVDRNTAFIGNPAADQMRKASELVFDDNEAIEIIGCTEIHPGSRGDTDESLRIAYNIFRALGGTLKNITDSHIHENEFAEVIINRISETGIDIYYDSSVNVLLGDKQYMLKHNIKVKTDANLHAATRGDDRSVIFMALDGVPKLGFIVNSRIKPNFLKLSERLVKSGVRVSVKTYEPHINDLYFEQNKGNSISIVSVNKSDEYEDPRPIGICDGCVISSSDAVELADAILQSDRIAKRCKLNRVINVMIAVANIVFAIALVVFSLGEFAHSDFLLALRSHIEIVFLGLIAASFIPALIEMIDIIRKK